MKLLRVLAIALLLGLGMSVAQAEPVDINTADVQTLADNINGVGVKRAEAIVAYREEHGPFTTIESLAEVKGIGAGIIEANRDVLLLSTPEGAQASASE